MFKRILPTALAIGIGILVLIGIFIPVSPLRDVSFWLIQWALIIGIFALFLAFLNLIRVHLARVGRKGKNQITSILIVASAVASVAIISLQYSQTKESSFSSQLLHNFLVPGESALLGLTAITLTLAGMRALQTPQRIGPLVFIGIATLILIGTVPYLSPLGSIAAWIQAIPATGGMRGILIGVALGTTLTGLRIIFGTTRPHSDD